MKTNIILHFVCFIIVLTFSLPNNAQSNDKFVVVLDAGHGGKDSGTPGTKRYKTAEKDIALDVTLALGKLIKKHMPNVKVLYTRTKDTYPTLNKRAVFANDEKADLFISIHCNAQPGGKGSAYGSETFVLGLHKNAANLEVAKRENSVIFLEDNYEETYKDFNPNSPESLISLILAQEDYLDHSIELANYIETEFKVTGKRKSRGVKQAGLYVLAYTYMPSVLVELGFLTNKKEEDYLNSKKGKQVMTKSLFNAIEKYVNSIFQNKLKSVAAKNDDSQKSSSEHLEQRIIEGVNFKVQIAASSRALEPKSYNFKGLKNISRISQGSLYKYFYGNTSDYNKAKSLVKEAKAKGYASSFVVAFKNGNRVSLADVLKTASN
ncbi:N-acetylmuramoyl-L-alanine amidase family protein [Hyunsoonleella pacifica]|uniref:N-acetylmuramoyl-L-alanine amidase n=1 Tax=Hyunsoonleella pacifica TaxID=1080224 RepID=A0A4Q9FRZ8_9FLAO|nr:N-acetylmuramoyl-L-alanine amidase [Hyunsoonleella pacifica]TBN17907.1 N-acetylmuramoyl-L-alanine amidase [Hyunsoonleella pacifica]